MKQTGAVRTTFLMCYVCDIKYAYLFYTKETNNDLANSRRHYADWTRTRDQNVFADLIVTARMDVFLCAYTANYVCAWVSQDFKSCM